MIYFFDRANHFFLFSPGIIRNFLETGKDQSIFLRN